MCGILGTYHYNISKEAFAHQLHKMQHRGPDGFGTWQSEDGNLQLGHRRLAIIDTDSRSNQPMVFNNRYVIVFNGEIYNYVELRSELQKEGVDFVTQSDTEVLLKLLALKGPEALPLLNGMWAFAFYDVEEKTLILSRDRVGEKPLYYLEQNNQFAFASEMKSLYGLLSKLDYDTAFFNFALEHPHDHESLPQTHIKDIKKFPAGMYAICRQGKIKFHSYYHPEALLQQPCRYKNFDEATEAFNELFASACSIRMRSDVPLGSALSGGIDSGLLVSTVARLGYRHNKDYTAVVSSFPGSALDETKEALSVANNAAVNAVSVSVNPDLQPDHILQAVYHFESIGGTSPIPFFQTYSAFRENNIIVTLDGHGGDELFGGYSFDMYAKLKDDFPNIFQMRNTLNTIDKMYGYSNEIDLKKTLPHFKGELLQRYKQKGAGSIFEKEQHFKQKLFQSTFKGILPTLLRNYDCYAMYAGVEIRMPYLDHRIIAFAFSLPNKYKVKNGFSKAILRRAGKGKLPDAILNNKEKKGWNSPMGEWFAGPWKEWLLDEISSTDFANCRLINTTAYKKKLDAFYAQSNSEHGAGQQLWLQLQPYLIEKANKQFANK